MTAAVFDLRDVCVDYDGERVLSGVDLRVDQGEFLAVLGENGSGKSTLIRAMLGLIPATSGSISLLGAPIAAFGDWGRVAYVPQRLLAASAVPVSVEEVVSASCLGSRLPRRGVRRLARARVLEALDAVGLAHRRRDRLDTLSGGQQRRVLVAGALAKGADAFLLDEPTAGVDAHTQERLAATFAALRAEGRTIILVTHELGPFAGLAGRVVVLARGTPRSVMYDGPPPVPAGLRERVWHHSDDLLAEPAVTGLLESG